MEYHLKPKYKEFTLENILEKDPLAWSNTQLRYNIQGPWNYTKPCLFRDKYNLLSAYQLEMEQLITPKLMPGSAPKLPLDHTNKLFGIVYTTLTGVIDTIIPAADPWSWVGKEMSYLTKLAPILWWALAANPVARGVQKTMGWPPQVGSWTTCIATWIKTEQPLFWQALLCGRKPSPKSSRYSYPLSSSNMLLTIASHMAISKTSPP
ncbi:hypothetical protein DSO57_1010434 [Entomophthora muscae]|uniref:Uncharacterized protein n=1 Tax=Entomophthora muscae TaxID=34485 RepID=A0ACC2RXN4_9FUNG|nr:hypothetical protein DSO57_1010434 [Entomophthora muscae]